jgi:hypothetical protein
MAHQGQPGDGRGARRTLRHDHKLWANEGSGDEPVPAVMRGHLVCGAHWLSRSDRVVLRCVYGGPDRTHV